MKPLIFVIFGASGDLTRRKLIPAVFDLFKGGFLPDGFCVLGVSRSKLSDDDFRDSAFLKNELLDLSGESEERKAAFAKLLHYQPVDTNDSDDYAKVASRMEELQTEHNTQGLSLIHI